MEGILCYDTIPTFPPHSVFFHFFPRVCVADVKPVKLEQEATTKESSTNRSAEQVEEKAEKREEEEEEEEEKYDPNLDLEVDYPQGKPTSSANPRFTVLFLLVSKLKATSRLARC